MELGLPKTLNDEGRGQPRVPMRTSVARSSSSVSFTLGAPFETSRPMSKAFGRYFLSLMGFAVFLAGCAYVKPFTFRVEDASTGEPVTNATVYWTESWQKISALKPDRTRSGFLFSGETNVLRVTGLTEAVDNKFRFTSKGYQPLTLEYIHKRG